MASSSGPALNEELQCSICLEVFTDPVTTPCGHNFCRSCLSKCWTNTQTCFCPLCKEKFSRRPDLKINTTLREVAEHFKEKLNPGEPEVFCDFCGERKQKAVKTCLTCQSSYCGTHLEPHRRVPRLMKHKLINAVENLEDYICQKHERPLELFCRADQTCVCVSCSEGEHKTHNTVPIEEESREKKNQLIQTQTDVHQMIQDRMKKIQEIQHSVEMRKRNTEVEKSSSVELFTDLIRSIERCQSELLKMMEEQQKAAEKQAEDLIKELEQEITELKRRNTEIEQLSHTDDHLHLIQIYPSICSPISTKKWTEINIDTKMNVHTLNKALIQLKGTLDGKLRQTVLKTLRQYGVTVFPDGDTVSPYLHLPEYGQGIEYSVFKTDWPDNPKRFDKCPYVLGDEGYNSGRFYYEMSVNGCVEWDFGVARESINRKGQITLSPKNGFWTMSHRRNAYVACDDPKISFYLRFNPAIIGVFVDYEEGLVSFYDVESCSQIYSFTGQTFTDKLYPFFGHNDKNNFGPMYIYDIGSYINEWTTPTA